MNSGDAEVRARSAAVSRSIYDAGMLEGLFLPYEE